VATLPEEILDRGPSSKFAFAIVAEIFQISAEIGCLVRPSMRPGIGIRLLVPLRWGADVLIDRYIFRNTFGAFVIVLVSLTSVIWVTQALRDIDLITNQGQSLWAFLGITSLIIPTLIFIIAPISLVIAATHTLNKLSSDSEIIVMNAAGMPPWRLFRPFLAVSLAVAAIVLLTDAYLSPEGLRQLRRFLVAARANLVTNIIKPGGFNNLQNGLTFHLRERQPNGLLLGIFVDDRRDPKERATFIAERGEILEDERGTFLVMENGSVQRREVVQRDPTIVRFTRYAFDLSQFSGATPTIRYTARERYLWELMFPAADDPVLKGGPGQFRAEFHDRLAAPIYPIAFMVITFAYLGAARTTRKSRAMSVVGLVAAVGLLRIIGYASVIAGVATPAALLAPYLAFLATFSLGLYAIRKGVVIEPPTFAINATTVLVDTLTRRPAQARDGVGA
jgi:lipopolysaccharide export system permease protein